MRKRKKSKVYVIGIDGGGTNTFAALADLNGKVLTTSKTGPSNPRNVGIDRAVFNVAEAIKHLLKKAKRGKIISTAITLPTIEEEYREKKEEILKALKHQKGISKIFRGNVKIFPDQIAALKSGTRERDGVLLIAGTGSVAHAWKEGRESKAGGWGWLSDEGSAIWIGQKTFQAVLKDLDKRGPETLLTELMLKESKVKNAIELLKEIYSQNPTKIISQLSIICDKASKKGDKIAKKIMLEAGIELSLMAKRVIKDLNFQKVKFPLVLVGSIFKSKIVLNRVKKEIKKIAPKVRFIMPQRKALGAVRLALEQIEL